MHSATDNQRRRRSELEQNAQHSLFHPQLFYNMLFVARLVSSNMDMEFPLSAGGQIALVFESQFEFFIENNECCSELLFDVFRLINIFCFVS